MNAKAYRAVRRGTAVVAIAGFLVLASGTSRTQDEDSYDLIACSHGNDIQPGSKPLYVSRIGLLPDDPETPADESLQHGFRGAIEFQAGTFFIDLSAYPTTYNPACVLGAHGVGSTNSGVMKFRTNMEGVENSVPTYGAVRGAKLVSETPLRDHYFITQSMTNGISSVGLSFIDVDAQSVLEHFEDGSLFHGASRGAEFVWWNNNTPAVESDDIFRWYYLDIDRIGWTDETVRVLELTDAQARTATPDPFGDPDPPHGPPFPQIATFLDTEPQVFRKLYHSTNGFADGNDDPWMDLASWKVKDGDPLYGNLDRDAHFIIGANTHFHGGNPPTWGTHLWGFDGGFPQFPRPNQNVDIDGNESSSPTFHQLKVVGNYCFLTTGIHLIWPGGVRVRSFRLQATGGMGGAGGTPSAAAILFQNSDTFTIPGLDGAVDGMVASYDQRHFFVGMDQSNNTVIRLKAHQETVDTTLGSPTYNFGFIRPSTPTTNHFERVNSVITFDTISMTTAFEDGMQPPYYPPNRVWPLLAGVSYRIITDLVGSFDGNLNRSPGEALGCSAGGAAATAGLLGGFALVAGLASAMRRK